jgi:hypothetical protein
VMGRAYASSFVSMWTRSISENLGFALKFAVHQCPLSTLG